MEAPNVDVLQDLRHASEKWREGCNLLDRAIAVIAAAAHHRQTIMLSPTSLASAAVLNNQTVQLSSARLDNSIAELGIRWDESGFLNDPTATGTPVSLFSRDHKTLLRKGGERRKSSIMAGSMRSIAGKSNSQSPTSSHAKLQMGPKAPSQSSILPSMVNITGVPQQSQSLVQSEKDSRRSSAAPMSRISSVKALKPQAAGKEGSTAHTLVHVPINNQHTAATFSMQILSLIPGKSRAIHASAASLPRHIAGKSQDSVRNAPVLAGNSQHEIASHMQRISHVSSGTAPGHWPGHSQNSIVMGTTRVLGSVDTFESSDAVQMQRNSENLSSTMPRRMLRGGQGSPVASLRVPTSIQNLHAMTASSGSASTHILKAPLPPLLNKQDPGTALLQPNNSSPNSDVSNASQAVRNNAYGLADANQNRETIEPNLDSNNVSSDSLNAELGSCGSLVILEEEELQPPPKIEDARGGGRGEQDVDAFRDSFDSLAMLETAMAMHHAPAFVHQRLKGMHVEATLTTLEEGSGENLKSSEISPPTTLTLQLEDTQLEPTPLLRDKPMPLLEMIGGSHILVNDPQKWRNATWEAWKAWWNERILVFCLTPAFGSNGKMLEREFDLKDLSELSFWVNGFHPKSIFITVYDLILSIELMMVLWLIPFMATFGEENVENECVSIVLTVLFGFNSVIELFTPISKVSKTILCSVREYEEKRPLLSDWTKDWVIREAMIAVATMIPFDVVYSSSNFSSLLLLFRLIRVMKLPEVSSRCALIQRMYVTLDRMVGMSISTTIPIAFVMMSFIHINACEMFFFGKRSGFVGWDAAFLGLDDATHVEFYAWTFMQGVSHMFPNSFIPQTVTEQVIGSLLVICAAVLYALFIGAISNSVMSVNPAGRLYFHKLEQLHDYVKWKNLAPETEKRLFKFYETKYRGKYFDEDLLLAEMNESLRAEISLENTRDLIEKVPFLRRTENDGRDVIFLGRLAAALHAQYYVAGDYITKQGESGKDMFFIRSGKLDVFVNDRKVVSLFDGAYIGEVALLAHVLRTATVQAAKPSVLYRLTHIDFHSILEDFVDMKDRIDRLAEERVAAIYEKRT